MEQQTQNNDDRQSDQLKQINKTLLDLYVITRESALNHITGEVFTVNSGLRDSEHGGTASNFFYKFPLFATTASRIVVLTASIPKTYYLVEENSLLVTEFDRSFEVKMPRGNYNAVSFRGTFSSLLTSGSATSGYGFLYSIDSVRTLRTVDTGLMTIRVQGNTLNVFNSEGVSDIMQIQPIFTVNESLHEQLGLYPNVTYTFANNSLTSVHVCNFNLLSQLFLRSDICKNSQDNILQDIYAVSNITNSYIVFENKSPMISSKKLNNNGQTYHFWLTDAHGNVVNLNGIEMSFTVLVY